MRKYIIRWADERDRRCVLTMTNTLANDGDTEEMELLPSGNPFVTSTEADTNPLMPVRCQTGKVGIIAEDGFNIVPANDHQWRVVLRRESEDRTMWTGWLKAETYNQRLWGVNEEVTLNVIDDVSAMKTWTLDPGKGFGMVSLRSLICECMDHVDGVTGHDALEMEWSMDVMPASGPWEELFDMQVSRYNFFSQVADSAAHEGSTCHAVLESICKTFGWTLTMVPATPGHDGMKMLFSYAGAYNYTRVAYKHFKAGEWTGASDSVPRTKYIEDMRPCNLHDYSIEPGYRKVKVVSQLNMVSNTLPSLRLDDAGIKWVEQFEVAYYRNGVEHEPPLPWRVRLLHPNNTLIKFPRYTMNRQGDEIVIEEYTGEVTSKNFDNLLGISPVSHDYWDGPEEDRGSTQEDEEKINYSWHESMLLYTGGMNEIVPFIIAKSAESCIFKNGGFEIGMNLHLQQFPRSAMMYENISPKDGTLVGPLKYGGSVNKKAKEKLMCMLRVGDKYWSGASWEKNAIHFFIPFKPQNAYSFSQVKSNKTLQMPFSTTNYAIPINTKLTGDVELQVFSAYLEKEDGSETLAAQRAIIENITFNYCTAESETTLDEPPPSHEYSHTEDGWTETANGITLEIYSDKNDPANYGVLMDKHGNTVTKMYDALNGVTHRPEEALLEKLKAHMTKAREVLTLRYTMTDGIEPRNEFVIRQKVYALLAVKEVDWCSGDAELIMEYLYTVGNRPIAPIRPVGNGKLATSLAFPLGG